MHKDMIWGNDEKYSKEFQEQCRAEQQKKYNALMEELAKKEAEKRRLEQVKAQEAHHNSEQKTGPEHYEINDNFIKQHLDAQIAVARWGLALGMAVTFLFKGQWLIWIMLIVGYILYTKKARRDAIEADKKKKK